MKIASPVQFGWKTPQSITKPKASQQAAPYFTGAEERGNQPRKSRRWFIGAGLAAVIGGGAGVRSVLDNDQTPPEQTSIPELSPDEALALEEARKLEDQQRIQALRKNYNGGITGWAVWMTVELFNFGETRQPIVPAHPDYSPTNFFTSNYYSDYFAAEQRETVWQAIDDLACAGVFDPVLLEHYGELQNNSMRGYQTGLIFREFSDVAPEPMTPGELAKRKDIPRFLTQVLPDGRTGRELLLDIARAEKEAALPDGHFDYEWPHALGAIRCAMRLPYPEGLGLLERKFPEEKETYTERLASFFAPNCKLSEDGRQVVEKLLKTATPEK